ncbi:synaptic vesicle glycoprotein 2B isoform X3 [Drosophila sulfurigaster albostrigata]|uniref:synaptic vesicle glycoprotein 2B isoform X3 n=1 Tax=Drosophila sulfurigaster albostrigata TaxID=89887 RepID=UPI002D21A93F|nr:synaptic vesicle glycoprotein 2B isoform X3 [Drosophila sulfurigaster albostrigata]
MAEAAAGSKSQTADFETAIAECGFGLFNVYILFCAMPCLAAMVFSASAMSYVMPMTECELKLSLLDKGIMHAVTYAGMIISAIPWGFVADTMGRRLVLISGGWMDGLCVLCAAMSQTSTQLMVFKFFDGFIVCGPFAVVVSNLVEFHGKKHRAFIMLFIGFSVALGALILTIVAYFLLPVHISFDVGTLHFHTWQIFLVLTALPSLTSGFLHIFLPESPRFLMSQGNYRKALKSLQRIYAMNKRKSRDSYPITTLTDATPERDTTHDPSGHQSLRERFARTNKKFVEGLQQLKPMFSSPYLALSGRIYCLHFCQVMCVNSIRLWLPQIFATMHTLEVHGVRDKSMCALLDHNSKRGPTKSLKVECDIHQQPESFMNNIIVAGIGLVGFLIFFPILRIRGVVNHILSESVFFVCTFLVGGLYFSRTSVTILIVASLYLTIMGVCASTIIGMCVVVFPTLMRTMVLLLIMTFGRLGSVAGNLLLPLFIQITCWAPFAWLVFLMSIAFLMSLFLKVDFQQPLN